jgi:excinuclease ABC subunit C
VTEVLLEKVNRLPQKPGVYIMKDAEGVIAYIGKATNLRSRVRSYFGNNDTRAFVQYLEHWLRDLDVIVTQSPKEALLLENTLIKKHRPRFNFMLRDDKNYLSLRVDTAHAWPRVELVRQIRDDGAQYFGPYHSAQSVRQTLGVINRFFHLRNCPDTVLNNRSRPCLQYQIKRCPAPCVLPISRDEYLDDVHHAMLFLQGRESELTQELEARMERAAEQLEFEQAAHLRDQITAIKASLQRQSAVQTTLVDQDIIGLHRQGGSVAVAVLTFRRGSLTDVVTFGLSDQVFPDEDLLGSFVSQFYSLQSRTPPCEIVIPTLPTESDTLEELLTEDCGSKVKFTVPQRGDRRKLIEMAEENARAWFDEHMTSTARTMAAVSKLREKLGLRQMPRTMECYDISNFQGRQIVASQVAFADGEPDKARYRKYRIRTTAGQDDFASMFEVLQRRAKQAMDGTMAMPDLIIIDGGKGQLNMAIQALHDLGFHDQEIVSLAKSRVVGTTADLDAPTYSPERVFLPGHREPKVLKQNSDELYLLTRIRDEAHRVAITYHRELRKKATLRSKVDEIDGIGPTKRGQLLRHFGSVKKLREAPLSAIESAPGMNRQLAARVYAFFHPDAIDRPTAFTDIDVRSFDDADDRRVVEDMDQRIADDGEDVVFDEVGEADDDFFIPELADDRRSLVGVERFENRSGRSVEAGPNRADGFRKESSQRPDFVGRSPGIARTTSRTQTWEDGAPVVTSADELRERMGTTRVIAAGSKRPRKKQR